MACCAESGACPMHKGESHSSGSGRVITQVQADNCCASSERENSSQSNPTFVDGITSAVLGTAIVLPASVPALVLSDGWRMAAPIPTGPIPKHVLLSVFIV
jgi:multisubunit Na+/H+ antiporter MnhC subunit